MSRRTFRLAAGAAVAGLGASLATYAVDGVLNGTPVMNGSARGTALTMFMLALPLLIGGLVRSVTGSGHGYALVIGSLAYLTYNAMLFVYATPFNELFPLYVALLALAFWALVSALLDQLPRRVPDRLPARAIAAYLLVVVVLNALVWLRLVVRDLGEDPPSFLAGTGLTTNPIYVQDLALWLPAMAIVAVLLWQRRPAGVHLGGAGLVFWFVEAVGVATDQWYGHRAAPESDVATLGGAVLFAGLAVATLIPLLFWFRATHEEASATVEGRRSSTVLGERPCPDADRRPRLRS